MATCSLQLKLTTEQRYAQIEKETLAIVHAFHKFDQLLFGKADVVVHSDHKPLEIIFKRPLADAPRRLQSMMLTHQRYTFTVEYRKGSTLHIADTLSWAPLPITSHKKVQDELVYRVELEAEHPDLSGFQDATLQEIRVAALTDPEQRALRSLVEAGWPNDKAAVPELARPYWTFRHELTLHDGLLFKQGRVIIPSSARPTILHKLHAAHRDPEFTIRHARSCVFWPGINNQVADLCKTCAICAKFRQQHPREPLQPYPVPTLPWHLVSQDLFELNGVAYLVTVDHFSDFYEIDRLPSLQSSAVVQATKQHFGRYGIPHTLLTDNGSQYTSDLFKELAKTYKFNHITSSPYWSQSNGRAEAAVKSAKHILRTAKDVDLALLSVRNTPPAGHTFSPAQRLFGHVLRSNLPQPITTLEPHHSLHDIVVSDHLHRKLQQKQAYDKHTRHLLPDFPPGSYVYAKPPPNSRSKAWVPGQITGSAGPGSYYIKTSTGQIRRNRVQVQLASPLNNAEPLPETNTTFNRPDKLRSFSPNPSSSFASSAAPTATPNDVSPSLVSSAAPTAAPNDVSPSPLLPTVPSSTSGPLPKSAPDTPIPPCLHNPPISNADSQSPSQPAPQVVTRSGRVVRKPARYSD